MRLDIKKTFSARSDRVKGIDFHPSEPWVLTTLYSGKAEIWSYETSTLVKTFDITNVPVRAGRFIARKNWVVLGSDDFQIRVYNYNTGEKVAQFEAHPDYIRAIAVHPTLSYVLTCSDDSKIKLWNWDHNWKLEQVFEGHQHYVMSVAFNPKDPNTFASASLDRSVKIWSLGLSVPNFTLLAHETKGVNYVEYYAQSDKPYIITSSDDKTIKVWDYQTKSCVAVLEGHISNVSFAVFHPELPLIVSGSEDATIKVWNANTYKLEKSLNYGLERAWSVSFRKGSNLVAVGFDAGHVVLQLADDKPSVSMDSMGKLIYAKNTDIFTSVIKQSDSANTPDGEVLPLSHKELGSVENFPTSLTHSPNGRFVTVTGDGEYIIYTALAWRNKSYGSALDFVWAHDSNLYAIRESVDSVKIFKNFQERTNNPIELVYSADKIFGGALLAVKSEGFVSFFDWESGKLVRRVDVEATDVVWSESGELVLIISSESAYALRFDRDIFSEALASNNLDPEEGCEESFEVLYDVNESIASGKWAGDVFIYTSATNRLNYLVGGAISNIAHFDKNVFLLGYLPRDNKIYVVDKNANVVSYHLSLNVLEYETVVLRGDLEHANEILKTIPESELPQVVKFLDKQGYKELALKITDNKDQKFDFAVQLKDLDTAYEIALQADSEQKWKVLGDASLAAWNLKVAVEAFEKSSDHESLLLLYTSLNDTEGLKKLADLSKSVGKYNVSFSAYWAANDVEGATQLLKESNRLPEASLFALTYTGDKTTINDCVELWKKSLVAEGKQSMAERICTPAVDVDKFPLVGDNQEEKEEDLIDVSDNVDVSSGAPVTAPVAVEVPDHVEEELVQPTLTPAQVPPAFVPASTPEVAPEFQAEAIKPDELTDEEEDDAYGENIDDELDNLV
ncbi:hypothetical protein LJB42_000271 [Komagataella kurtzmanii]|nr:hypothetical protein LJB42_000271 [Komagataella kurtzmanii]